MSLINMQDGVVKSPLVQQFQHRGAELARVQQGMEDPFHSELARQAEETVRETPQSENEGINNDHDDGENPHGESEKRERDDDQDGENAETRHSSDGKPHQIDITI